MLMPKRVKHRKQHRGRRAGKASGGTRVSFGEFGLQAMEACWMTANQIEAARIAMNRYIRRQGKIWIRIFPDKPFTKKPAETRMGSGKGAPDGWVAVVKPGRMLFEMAGVSEEIAREAMRLAAHKLPIETKFVKREEASNLAVEEEDDAEDTADTDAADTDTNTNAASDVTAEAEDVETVADTSAETENVAEPAEAPTPDAQDEPEAADAPETEETNA